MKSESRPLTVALHLNGPLPARRSRGRKWRGRFVLIAILGLLGAGGYYWWSTGISLNSPASPAPSGEPEAINNTSLSPVVGDSADAILSTTAAKVRAARHAGSAAPIARAVATIVSQPNVVNAAPTEVKVKSVPRVSVKTPKAAAGEPQAPRLSQTAKDPTAIAELKRSDVLIRDKKYAAAEAILLTFVKVARAKKYLAQAHYRLGYIARRQKNEKLAHDRWLLAYEAFPDSVGGRLSALAIASDLYARHVTKAHDTRQWEKIRQYYSVALGMDHAKFIAPYRAKVIAHLKQLNKFLVFSRAGRTKNMIIHTVGGGEFLSSIAKKYGVHFNSIATLNHIRAPQYNIRKNQKLRILKGESTVVVSRRELMLTLYIDGQWIKEYQCAVGPDAKTAPGVYRLETKDTNPAWTNPEDGKVYAANNSKNTLGSRWMGLADGPGTGLGIHGTTLPESVPGRTSNGCIRLLNKDVEELYGFALIGSKVIILQ